MNRVGTGLFVVLGSLAVCACGAPSGGAQGDGELVVEKTTSALESEETTQVPVVFVCNESTAFYLLFEVTAPTTVAPSEAFPATINIPRLIPPTVAPFPGTMSSSQELLATFANPASQVLPLGSFHFATGDILGNIGTATANLTAANHVGAPIVLNAGAFDYTITEDQNSGDFSIHGHCVPPNTADQPSTLATILVVNTPATKDDCKQGGWQTRTDEAGGAFKNEGLCIDYVLH